MENAGKSVVSPSSREEEDAKAKKPRMRLERKRTRVEELKVLSDLSVFQNLAAMLEAEKFKKKKKRRRKKKKKNVEVAAQEDGAVNVAKEDEQEDAKAKKPRMRLGRKRTREEELKVLSDLSVFQNLAEMLEAEKFRKKKKRRRKKKKKNVEVAAEEDGAVNVAKEEEQVGSVKDVESNDLLVSENVVPQKPLVDAAYEDKANTVIAAETETKPVEISEKYVLEKDLSFTIDEERGLQKAKRPGKKNEEVMSSLDEFKMLSDLSNFKNLAAMMEAEAFMRRKKIKRTKQKRKVDVGQGQEQPDTVKAVTTTKALETGSVSVSENIMPEKLFVDEVKAGAQPDTIKAVDMRKATETESVSVTKNIVAEKLFVDSVKEQKQVDTCKSVETVKLFQIESIDIKDNIVLQKLLQAPRYFDPPESSCMMCHNCGEEGHTAVVCSAEKQKKPCFLCGSFKHSGNHCKRARNCFVYERSLHIKSCPEKNKGNCPSSMICLRCGSSGHDMFSCRKDYSSDDLKEIQCYACKRFGHLCCVDFPDIRQLRQVSCYKCGHSGHWGSDKLRMGG